MRRERGIHKTLRALLASERGWSLTTVMGVAVILFLMLTMIFVLLEYSTSMTSRTVEQTKRLHLADAGINVYLYQLKSNPSFYVTNPTVPETPFGGGTYDVQAYAPNVTQPLTLIATGKLTGASGRSRLKATVRFPTFADFMFLSDSAINIGAGADIYGKVRANGTIRNDGRCHDLVQTAQTVSGAGTYDDGYQEHVPTVDFNSVTGDLSQIRSSAQASGVYLPPLPSSNAGYYVRLNGSSLTYQPVLTMNVSTGVWTLGAATSRAFPANGAVYVDNTAGDFVWVDGAYAGRLTIGTNTSIKIRNNLTRGGGTSSALGLIAQSHIQVPTFYSGFPNDLTIEAAMVAQTGRIEAEMVVGTIRNSVTITGSMAYAQQSGFTMMSGSTVVAGFRNRTYQYDPNLDLYPPPLYPVVRDGSLKIGSWTEYP